MITRQIKKYSQFLQRTFALLATQRLRLTAFVVLSILTALTEGLGVTMLVPVIESMNTTQMFGNIPVLGAVSRLFGDLEANERLRMAAAAMLVVVLLRGILTYAVNYLTASLPKRISQDISIQAYNMLVRADFLYVLSTKSGDTLNFIRTLPNRIGQLLTNMAHILVTSLVIAVYLVLMVAISWQMTIAALVFMALVSEGIKAVAHKRAQIAGQHISEETARLHQILYETLNGFRLIRLTVNESAMARRWRERTDVELQASLRLDRLLLSMSPLLATASGILICVLIFAASLMSTDGTATGGIILFMFLLFRLLAPVSALNGARTTIQSDMHALEVSKDFMAAIKANSQKDGTKPFQTLQNGLRLESMSFAYPSGSHTALTDINVDIPKGSMIAIVGPSGSGKSTLVNLLTRFFDPTAGRITVDGHDLRDLQISSWRKRIGMVSQEITLFNDTALNNLRFGQEGASLEDVRAAAKLASIDDFLSGLPEGYDTMLGERGTRLSGGQQQRIALARAILADPELLILDEATSHLDAITERAIQDAVEGLRHKRTIIVIAHRLSTIQRADRIVVMEQGCVVEQGTHDALLRQNGRYADMIEHQKLDLVTTEDTSAVN